MNNPSRRNFLRALAIAPLAILPITVLGKEGQRYDVEGSDKKYIFCFPNSTEEGLNAIKKHLSENGYKDCLVMGGQAARDFQLYELPKSSK